MTWIADARRRAQDDEHAETKIRRATPAERMERAREIAQLMAVVPPVAGPYKGSTVETPERLSRPEIRARNRGADRGPGYVTPGSETAGAPEVHGAGEGGATAPVFSPEGAEVRCVAQGVDTLYLCAHVRWAPSIWDDLEAAQQEARRERREGKRKRNREGAGDERATDPLCVSFGGSRWKIGAEGSESWTYLLVNGAWSLGIRDRNPDDAPNAYLEIRAHVLWRLGYERAFELAADWLAAQSVDGEARVLISRIDLAVDVQGLAPPEERRPFVCRAVQKGKWHNPRDFDRKLDEGEVSQWWNGLNFTGWRFGKSGIVVRLYNKPAEIHKSGKAWIEEVWRQNGWRGDAEWKDMTEDATGRPIFDARELEILGAEPQEDEGEATRRERKRLLQRALRWRRAHEPWRVEVQLRREALKTLIDPATGSVIVEDEDPHELLRSLQAVWAYLVGAPEEGAAGHGHFTWCVPSHLERKRWDAHERWRVVQLVSWASTGCDEVLRRRGAASAESLMPQLAGCASSFAARAGWRGLSIVDAFTRIGQAAETWDRERKGGCWEWDLDRKLVEFGSELAAFDKEEA